jgi:hypothetical protein
MKPSEALKVARENILSHQTSFICHALPRNDAGIIVSAYIKNALSGTLAYRDWLSSYHFHIAKNMTYENRQEGRIQWIDWMIEQYEGIGE